MCHFLLSLSTTSCWVLRSSTEISVLYLLNLVYYKMYVLHMYLS